MLEELLEDVDERMRSGDSIPCFSSVLLENKEKYNLTNKEIAWAAGTLIAGGMATTSAAMHYFVLAMCLYPHAMRKAQAEIDRVVGRYRLPKLADSNSLPYIRAMVKELLRWRPIGPAGVARSATVDDWYNGYFIPKGSIVVYNVWSVADPQE
ncbi:hypothetical protein VKT23_014531 [Stygiomarasmius scandens]|uniref:Cytochrome P450 n=1 Tax=Marasmiellus scandens TaxID=2682957 RepID=A0ABR1J4V3_9AGAR